MHKLESRRNSWTSCTHMRCRTVVLRYREARGSLEEAFHFAVVASWAVLWLPVLWLICKIRLPCAPEKYRKMNLQSRMLGEREESVYSQAPGLWGFSPADSSLVLAKWGSAIRWSKSPAQRAAAGLGSRARCHRQLLLHHMARWQCLKSLTGSMGSQVSVLRG